MNELDRHLAELALINQVDLQPNASNGTGKKVGPAVPPKPKKNQPQVSALYTSSLFFLILNFIWHNC